MSSSEESRIIDVLTLLQNLKLTKRTGWLRRNLKDPESVADHMHRMCMMAFLTPATNVYNLDKCLKLALVHDVAEALVGDITPHDGISKVEKHNLEANAMSVICSKLGNNIEAGSDLLKLWDEYNAAETQEAKLVKDFDKLEMMLQALEYEQSQQVNLEEFFESSNLITTDLGKKWASEILKRRKMTTQEADNLKGS